jgi:hypothetical protein
MSSTIFNNSIVWQSKFDSEPWLYLVGVTQTKFETVILVNSKDTEYTDNTAFYLVSQDANSKDRTIFLNSTDAISLFGLTESIPYGIDDTKGLLIFDPAYAASINTALISAKVVKNVASIWKRNLENPQLLIDFSYYNERVITCVESNDDGLFLGGASGKIWFYDGVKIKEIYELNLSEPLPAACMVKHKPAHDSNTYLYVGSDNSPGLFRAKLSEAQYGNTWEYVTAVGANPGGILCMVSAYNKIIMGLRNNQCATFEIVPTVKISGPSSYLNDENVTTVEENNVINLIDLTADQIADFDREIFDVQSMIVANNKVVAGLSDRPEIWTYSEIPINNPLNDEEWATQIFDQQFINDPAPAQYYTVNGVTNSRNQGGASHELVYDLTNPSKTKSMMRISGVNNSETVFEFSTGSDWEQVIGSIQTQTPYNEVDCGTTENIDLAPIEFPIIDGFQTANNSTVLVKNQDDASENGIYIINLISGTPTFSRATFNPGGVDVIGFIVKNGYINGNTRFLVATNDVINNNYNFYQPKYTVELELANLGLDKFSNEDADPIWLGNTTSFASTGYIDLKTDYYGYQGIEISDGYREFSLEFSTSNVKISSGNNVITKDLISYGFLQNWNFIDIRNTSGWEILGYLTDLSVVEFNEVKPDLLTLKSNALTLSGLSLRGNPSIVNYNVNLDVEANSKVYVKLKIQAPSGYTLSSGELRLSWSYGVGKFTHWTSVELKNSTDYVLYELSPSWVGKIKQIALELYDLPQDAKRPTSAQIDFIQVVNKDKFFDINLFLSAVRINVEDKNVKVWLGNQDYPFFDLKNFIIADTYKTSVADYDRPFIKIGKLNPTNDQSFFGYSKLRFIAGENYEPTSKKILNFHNSWRMPSAGGIRILTYHDGTLYAISDGLVTNRMSDNPDDRQIKLFVYDSKKEIWTKEDAQFARKIDSNSGDIFGIVRALTAKSFKQSFYLSGQYSSIKYNSNS